MSTVSDSELEQLAKDLEQCNKTLRQAIKREEAYMKVSNGILWVMLLSTICAFLILSLTGCSTLAPPEHLKSPERKAAEWLVDSVVLKSVLK